MIKHIVLFGFLILTPAAAVLLAHPSSDAQKEARVARGKYIVNSFGCTDCHTPFKMGPNGPEKDAQFFLAGHPAKLELPPAPKLKPNDPWNTTVAATLTAWSGPWGTSFTANLTPDDETGTGKWTEQEFVDTIRSGRHLGRGRQILPPMPVEQINNMTDEDLRSIYAYLRTVPAVSNKVPQPIPPAE